MKTNKQQLISLISIGFAIFLSIITLHAQVSHQVNQPRKFEDTLFKRIYVVTNKTKLDKYYKRADIQEWYKKRIQPPPLNMNVDLKKFSDLDLWFLKYELFARNGFLFDDPVLRAHFKKFPWYQPIWDEPNFSIELTQQEYDFLKSVIAEEKAREKNIYTSVNGQNVYKFSSAVNREQFLKIPDTLADALRKRNFAIVPSDDRQLYYAYDKNAYDYTPNFITTDAYLQCIHVYLTGLMSHIEEEKICPLLFELMKEIAKESSRVRKSSSRDNVRSAASWVNTYSEIALSLLEDTKRNIAPEMQSYLDHEFEQIKMGVNDTSVFLRTRRMSYMQFIPRGNYSRTRPMQSYFRAMKWLLSAPMYVDSSTSFSHALLLASILSHSDKAWKTYSDINKCMALLVGKENNLSLNHLVEILQHDYPKAEFADLLRSDVILDISGKLLSMNPKQYSQANDKLHIFFYAGRYTVDNDILYRVVNQDTTLGLREYPKGLDVFSALGNSEAERLLKDTSVEKIGWRFYQDSLKSVKNRFSDRKNWSGGIFERMMKSLLELQKKDKSWPAFMQNEAWDRKNLNTALGAWAELRHDMLLYTESAASECGDGDDGPPPPKQQSYVEPNVAFWQEATELLRFEEKTLADLGLLTVKIKNLNSRLVSLAELLRNVSKKELANVFIPDSDMTSMHWIGGNFESIINEIQTSENSYGMDTDMAIVADVFVNNNGFLEAGVGHADYIYTIVNINGALYIAKGSIFSYYEFFSPGEVWTDESWRQSLEKNDDEKRPVWMKDLIIHVPPPEVSPDYQF